MLNGWVASCQGTRMVILSGTARPWNIIFIWTHTYLPRFCVPRYFILSLRCIAFRICKACYRENSFCPKTTPQERPFWGEKKCTLLSLGGAGGQTVHNRSTFGEPLKTYGHNASNELRGRSVASKLRRIILPG